jgi:hypothetical protein
MIGGTVIPYPLWKPLPESLEAVLGNPAGKGSVFTVHPLGGCGMADDGSAGMGILRAGFCALIFACTCASAQPISFRGKSVTMVIGFPAGGVPAGGS